VLEKALGYHWELFAAQNFALPEQLTQLYTQTIFYFILFLFHLLSLSLHFPLFIMGDPTAKPP
jgi:hypothetical protein